SVPDRLHPGRQCAAAPPGGGGSRAGRRPAGRGGLAGSRRVHLRPLAQLAGLGSHQWLLLLAPIVVGADSTVWGGNAVVGRRAVRLAAVTAALSIYLYGVLAVAVHGAAGHDPSDGWTTAQIVGGNLGNQAVFYLMALPLMTATIGWAAAAAT